jgi:hypothetical protein
MEQSNKLALKKDTDQNGKGFSGRLGLVNYNASHQPTETERGVKDKLAGQLAEIDATALKAWHAGNLLDQLRVNDQHGFRDTSARLLLLRDSAENDEHAEIMAEYTDANLQDYANTKLKLLNIAGYRIATVVEESVRPDPKPARRGLLGLFGG